MYCWPCSPDSQYFYNLATQKVKMCSSMCDRIFDTCADAVWKGKTVRDSFASGQ